MNTAATILTRKEIVAVLIELEKKISELDNISSTYQTAQLTTFTSLRHHFLDQLMEMNKHIKVENKVA